MSRLRILILLKKFTAVLYTVHTTAFFFWVLWTVSGNGDGFGRQHLVNGVGIVTRTISFCSCDTKATTQGISTTLVQPFATNTVVEKAGQSLANCGELVATGNNVIHWQIICGSSPTLIRHLIYDTNVQPSPANPQSGREEAKQGIMKMGRLLHACVWSSINYEFVL